ncbi:MAG: MFS transporter, partial [Candidatus Dormibacteraeota bacterium]|nr:MFS transporter [Candidatus Dormibacteraeota bacterium]
TLLPALFAGHLGTGGLGFGLGVAAAALGATAGGVLVLGNGRAQLRRSLLWPGVFWALAMVVTGWSGMWPLTLAALAVTGAMQTWLLSILGQRLFDAVPDRERGPMMSLYAACAVGTNWIGPLQAGLLALALGVPLAFSVDAALLILAAIAVGLGFRTSTASTEDRATTSAAR